MAQQAAEQITLPDDGPQAPDAIRVEDLQGLEFASPEDAFDYLKFNSATLDQDEQLITHTMQERPEYAAIVLVTDRRMALVLTGPDQAPLVKSFRRLKKTDVVSAETPVNSTLHIYGKKHYEITDLPKGDARRIEDVVNLVRIGYLERDTEIPDAITFEGTMPAQYYELMLGPNGKQLVDTVEHGIHRFELWAFTGDSQGYFLPKWFRRTKEGEWEHVDAAGFRPFYAHKTTITRPNATKPYQINVLPAADEDIRDIMESMGIVVHEDAKFIVDRYTKPTKLPALMAVRHVLRHLGLEEGVDGAMGYRISKGSNYDYLVVHGKKFKFDKEGNAINVTKVHRMASLTVGKVQQERVAEE